MFIVNSYALAVIFCFITMMCWGSWGNTQKLAARNWRYELFYWDYVIGMLLFSLVICFTMGSFGSQGRSFIEDLGQADAANIWSVILGGVIFNASNILLSASTSIAGMSVAFPLGVGLSLVLGVIINYLGAPKGDPVILFLGVALIVVAIICNGIASGRMQAGKAVKDSARNRKGLILAVVAGVLMSFFYRFVAKAMDLGNFEQPAAGMLTPYTAIFIFSVGVVLSNFLFNSLVMRYPFVGEPVKYRDYFQGSFKTHLTGMLGGAIWCLGTAFSYIASGQAGAAISYALGQGAPMIAAVWGVFIWKEFKGADRKTNRLLILMFIFFISGLGGIVASGENTAKHPEQVTISKIELLDKIKGGWAGQTIGCTYGGPTEFKYNGTMIQDYIPIKYEDGCIKWWYENVPGLYDDVYMDLTFVDIFDKYGLDAPVEKFAYAFANAGYNLWHANQAARYNILNGIMPPESGHWKNNPHADDIDFQIEADYAGLMSPAMINTAVSFTDDIGHIMNFGDGWYGGVYVAAMYSLAFIYDDIETIVKEALQVIPAQSKYYKCMSDVIEWYYRYPDDWKKTWFECEKKWSSDKWCPDGVFVPFNIDATINSAYVLIGLLYGHGDFSKTVDIATRCGQDSDCNPATAAGILGTMLGYSQIPSEWIDNLKEVEDMNFAYTDISLNKVYEMSYSHALKVIERNGGFTDGENLIINCEQPESVRYEESFPEFKLKEKIDIQKSLKTSFSLEFTGNGFVSSYIMHSPDHNYVAEVEVILDGNTVEVVKLPAAFKSRKPELYYNYELDDIRHEVIFKWLNPVNDVSLDVSSVIVYSEQ